MRAAVNFVEPFQNDVPLGQQWSEGRVEGDHAGLFTPKP